MLRISRSKFVCNFGLKMIKHKKHVWKMSENLLALVVLVFDIHCKFEIHSKVCDHAIRLIPDIEYNKNKASHKSIIFHLYYFGVFPLKLCSKFLCFPFMILYAMRALTYWQTDNIRHIYVWLLNVNSSEVLPWNFRLWMLFAHVFFIVWHACRLNKLRIEFCVLFLILIYFCFL